MFVIVSCFLVNPGRKQISVYSHLIIGIRSTAMVKMLHFVITGSVERVHLMFIGALLVE